MPQFTVHLLIPIKVELEVEADTAEAVGPRNGPRGPQRRAG